MDDAEEYAIVSVCGVPGTLHVYNPRDNAPRHSQTQCHVRAPGSAVATSTHLLALTQAPNSTTASLSTHDLTRVAGPAARKSAAIEPLTVLTTSHSGTLLAAGASSGQVHIWHLPTGSLLTSFMPHLQAVTALAFSDDDDLLLTAAVDASVVAFATAPLVNASRKQTVTPQAVLRLSAHTLPVVALAVGYAGASARVATVAADRSLRIWHLASCTCLATLLLPSLPVDVVMAADESAVFVGLVDGAVVCVQLASLPFQTVQTVRKDSCIPCPPSSSGDALAVTSLALSPHASELVVGYSDGVVRIFDVATRTHVHAYSKHSTTAPVSFVTTMLRIPEASNITRDALPPLSRTSTVDVVFTSSIDTSCAPQLDGIAWDVIENAISLNFDEDDDDDLVEGAVVRNDAPSAQQGDGASGREDIVLDELVGEVTFLRNRNKQLEVAGRKLSALVVKHCTN